MSSYDTHYNNTKKKLKESFAEEEKKRLADDEALKQQVNATIDKSAAAQTGVYQQEIENAPLESRALYDKNALEEAVNRKKIQESLANMGMTDSGLSSSMQTALTVQKSRADNSVRVAEQQRISAAKSAIDQILANAEAQKASEAISIDTARAEWGRNQRQNIEAQAVQSATSMYNAEVEAATKASEQALEYQNNRAKMAQSYINNGQDATEAWAQAYYAYPDTSTQEGARYAYYNQLKADGYNNRYAGVMSRAYTDALAANASAEKVSNAVVSAMLIEAEKESREFGMTPAQVSLTDLTLNDALSRMSQLANDCRESYMIRAKQQGVEVSNVCAEYVTAKCIGTDYSTILTDANAQQIGEALARNFNGVFLEIALSYAGLE